MRNLELFALAWRNLMRRKSRTFLTVLSVVIGAVAIILMLSFGYGMQETERQQIEQYAQLNAITVYPTGDFIQNSTRQGLIGDREVKNIQEIPHVKGALPMMNADSLEVRFDDDGLTSMFAQTWAVDFSQLDPATTTFTEGGIPASTRKHPYLVGSAVNLYKYDLQKMEGEFVAGENWSQYDVRVKPMTYGSEETGGSLTGKKNKGLLLTFGGEIKSSDLLLPSGFYISLDTYDELEKMQEESGGDGAYLVDPFMERAGAADNRQKVQSWKARERFYDQLIVTVDDLDNTQSVVDTINDTMGLSAQANSEMIDSQMEAFFIIQLIFGGIGSVALLVSAIGIANTMLMSIHERTREIGVMKVIGAQVSDIRRMFLIEAVVIALIGGVIGVVASFGLSALVNVIARSFMAEMSAFDLEYISYIPAWLPIVAFIFSGIIGLLAGWLPARRATRISAIEAIRTE